MSLGCVFEEDIGDLFLWLCGQNGVSSFALPCALAVVFHDKDPSDFGLKLQKLLTKTNPTSVWELEVTNIAPGRWA